MADAPDPPAEAVEAAVHAIAQSTQERRQIFADSVAIKAGLAAALPHLRAQVLAELDAQRYAYSVAREQALREEIRHWSNIKDVLVSERDDARAEAERWKSLAMKLMVQAPIIMGEK